MTIMKNVLPQLNSLVAEGLFVDNLRKIESICRGTLILGECPAVFYVLQNVCRDLRMRWDDTAVTVEEYNDVCAKLTEPIQRLLNAVEMNVQTGILVERLNALIQEMVRVQSHED